MSPKLIYGKNSTWRLDFCVPGCKFLVHVSLTMYMSVLTTAGLTGILQLRSGLRLMCLNSVRLNVVKPGNRMMIVILRDILMLFTPIIMALPRQGSANQAVSGHHVLDKGGRLILGEWSSYLTFLLDFNNLSRLFFVVFFSVIVLTMQSKP